MNLTQTHKILIGAAVVVVLLGSYVLFDRNSKKNVIEETTLHLPVATTTGAATGTTSPVVVQASGTGNFQVQQVSPNEGRGVPQPIPSLDRPITFGTDASLTTEVRQSITEKVKGLQADLKKDPSYLAGWISLGLYQKMAGDYAGAALSWQYAVRLDANTFAALSNLGDLYAYYLKDTPKAEMYYKQAISAAPQQGYIYFQFAIMYRDVVKDTTKAKAIVDAGLARLPQDQDLLKLKASL